MLCDKINSHFIFSIWFVFPLPYLILQQQFSLFHFFLHCLWNICILFPIFSWLPVDLNSQFSGSGLGLDALRTRQGSQCDVISLHVSDLPQASPVDPTWNFSFRLLTFLQLIPIYLSVTMCYLFFFFATSSSSAPSSSPVKSEQQPLSHSLTVRLKSGHLCASLSRIPTITVASSALVTLLPAETHRPAVLPERWVMRAKCLSYT